MSNLFGWWEQGGRTLGSIRLGRCFTSIAGGVGPGSSFRGR